MPNSSGGLELIDFLADAVATLLRIAKAQNEQLQQLGAVAAEEESLHDIRVRLFCRSAQSGQRGGGGRCTLTSTP